MDESPEKTGQRPAIAESGFRKDSLSDKLNKLTNNAFSRRRTSNTDASSDSFNSLPRRSYIPTPSLGSRTSSLFGGLGLNDSDAVDSSGAQSNNRKGSQTRRSTASTGRYSHIVSDSTSSFFGNTSSGSVYPREFLEHPDAGTERKENRTRSTRPTEGSHSSQRQQAVYHQPPSSPQIGRESAEYSDTNEASSATAKRNGENENSTPGAMKRSRRISSRLTSTHFFKNHSVRHSIAAVTLTSPARSRESSVKIEERRLMAPINPPLLRSTTMGPLNTPSVHSAQHSSPRTPNFMRPTSSSAARRSEIPNSYKTAPIPLKLPSGQHTADIRMLSFGAHRECKRAAKGAAMTLETSPQVLAQNELRPVQEQALPSSVPCSTSTPELGAAYTNHESRPPAPRLPKQLITPVSTTGPGSKQRELPRVITQSSRIPRSSSSTADKQIQRAGNQGLGMQPSSSARHLPLTQGDQPWICGPTDAELRATQATVQAYRAADRVIPPRKTSLAVTSQASSSNMAAPVAAPSNTAPQAVDHAVPGNSDDEDKDIDLTLIRGAQDLRFWAGRYTAMSDHVRNDALVSPEAASYAHYDQKRQRVVLQYLKEKCANEEARESLNAFVRAWAHGWTGGVGEAFLGVAPVAVTPAIAAPAVEEKKKGGFMGKVFGRKKS
ncbi:MAG: hypothetical protein Q9166_004377 [cf. Caloplaca sp. 2 TL-2023]